MKCTKLVIVLAIMTLPLFPTGLKGNPPDECLKMVWPDETGTPEDSTTYPGGYSRTINPDSVMVDSCENSPTFREKYAKKKFRMYFDESNYPFNSVLDSLEEKSVDDIPLSKIELRNSFLALENLLGSYVLVGLDPSDKEFPYNLHKSTVVDIVFEDYQNIDSVCIHFKNTTSIEEIEYLNRAFVYCGVQDKNNQSVQIYPNPSKTKITVEFEKRPFIEKINIYTVNGELVKTIDYTNQIDISDLPMGIYFMTYGNQTSKFIKE